METVEQTLSVEDVARRIGISTQAVYKAVRSKRLMPCTEPSERPRFDSAEVDRFDARRRKRMADKASGLVKPPADQETRILRAKTAAVTDLVERALVHTEQAWKDTREGFIESRKHAAETHTALLTENQRLRARNEALESRVDDLNRAHEVLAKSAYDKTIAEAEASRIKDQGKALIETAKTWGPAVLARIFGGEELNIGAFKKLVDGLTETQKDKIFSAMSSTLTEDQFGVLLTILSGWEGKETKEKERAAPHDTEPPSPA